MSSLSVIAATAIYRRASFPVNRYYAGADAFAPATVMIRLLPALIVFISHSAYALDSALLNIAAIAAGQWKLENIHIALSDSATGPQKLSLTIEQARLPKPFDDLSLINIRCSVFTWQDSEVSCQQGRAQVRSKRWQSPSANFSFYSAEKKSRFKLADLRLAGGTIRIEGEQRGEQWALQVNAKAVDVAAVQKLLPQTALGLPVPDVKEGNISFALKAAISHSVLTGVALAAELNDLSAQTKDGRLAGEKVSLETRLDAENNQGLWQWQSHTRLNNGALYREPLYLETGGQGIVIDAQGDWSPASKLAQIKTANYRHGCAIALSGTALVRYDKGLALENAELSLRSGDLQQLSAVYLAPFFAQTALEGIALAGQLAADFSIAGQSLTALTATVHKLGVNDAAGRVEVQGGEGTLNWSGNGMIDQPSTFSWQQLHIHGLPVGPAGLSFLSRAHSFRLLEKAQLPFLGGAIVINAFGWQTGAQQEPDIYFEGALNDVSLQQLSQALNWAPLSGNISGSIPRVDYKNNVLSLDGELIIKVFDGLVKFTHLAASGLFTGLPRFYGELEIDHLDLEQLTGKFEFGGITGKLSGFVRQLTIENGRPVTFYAWLGTPDDDDSRHRISQKAVKNIASIGGGGVSDIVSRSFLNLFETFSYDQIGIGCYLHDGVCQLMGVEATKTGYTIVKGGGLPRIDVIGYNPRVDWDVLMERLNRISASDEVIIK